jgi:hypothetical protein
MVGKFMLFFILVSIFLFIVLQVSSNNNSDNTSRETIGNSVKSNHEKTLIEILYPLIDILCHYSMVIEKEWTSEKVRNIKMIFEKDCSSEKQLALLRDRIKLNTNAGVKPPVNLSISKYLALNPDSDSKISLFQLLINILGSQSHDQQLIIKISLDFSEKINIPQYYAKEILKEFGYFMDDDHKKYSNNTNYHERENDKDIAWAFKVFNLEGNTSNLTKEMISKKFQQKIKEFHPDKNGSVTDAVREILNQKTSDLYDAREILLNYISKI